MCIVQIPTVVNLKYFDNRDLLDILIIIKIVMWNTKALSYKWSFCNLDRASETEY